MSEKTEIVHGESDQSAGSRTTNMKASDAACAWLRRYCPLERYELSRGEFGRRQSRCRWWSADKPRERVPVKVRWARTAVSRVPCVIAVDQCWAEQRNWAVEHWQRCRVYTMAWRAMLDDKECEFRGREEQCLASRNGESMLSWASRKSREVKVSKLSPHDNGSWV